MLHSAQQLADEYSGLQVLPVCADYTARFSLPCIDRPVSKTVVYFPDSTIGNFHPAQPHIHDSASDEKTRV